MLKKLLTLSFSLLMIMSLLVFPASALDEATAKETSIPGGARSATAEQIAAAEKNVKEHTPQASLRARGNKVLRFQYFGQETSMSCGPASVKMMLNYIEDAIYLESYIRDNTYYTDEEGTYLTDLVAFLNREQNKIRYTENYNKSLRAMNMDLQFAIYDEQMPALIGVVESASDGFPYNGNKGHFVVVSGANDMEATYRIADPWAGYVNDSANQYYNIDQGDLYAGYYVENIGYAY